MIIDPRTIILKDGRTAILRSPDPDDAEKMIHYMITSSGETEFLLRYPEEASNYTIESEEKLLKEKNASPNEAFVACYVEGKIAGNSAIFFDTKLKTKHRASVAIALLREFWGLGIGTEMLAELIGIAQKREGVMQLELDYIEGNVRARALYEKVGFRITGVRPNAVRLKDGTLLNEYMMVKQIR